MEENVTRIQYHDKEILLIGTAHVSKQSVELVRQVAMDLSLIHISSKYFSA